MSIISTITRGLLKDPVISKAYPPPGGGGGSPPPPIIGPKNGAAILITPIETMHGIALLPKPLAAPSPDPSPADVVSQPPVPVGGATGVSATPLQPPTGSATSDIPGSSMPPPAGWASNQ
jgi:hypothetical protein